MIARAPAPAAAGWLAMGLVLAPACASSEGEGATDGSTSTTGSTSLATGSSGGGSAGGSSTGDALPEMVEVPGGPFGMGCNQQADDFCHPEELPAHSVGVSGFWIDTTEVTQASYAACVEAGSCSAPELATCDCADQPCAPDVYDPLGRAEEPIRCVTWAQAGAYCAFGGKRLPTEAEWEKAARGVKGAVFPWGNELAHCGLAVGFDDGCGGNGPAVVGSRPAGASPYGALDMAGNVAEWVHDRIGLSYYDVSPPDDPPGAATPWRRGTRGGGWRHHAPDLRTTRRRAESPLASFFDVGFRCVAPDAGVPICGDGTKEPSEACDDGNTVDGDGCSATCEPSGALAWDVTSSALGDLRGIVRLGTGSFAIAASVPTVSRGQASGIWGARVGDSFPSFASQPTGDPGDDHALGLGLDAAGDLILVGDLMGATDSEVLVRRYAGQAGAYAAMDGSELLDGFVLGSGLGPDEASAVALAPNGHVIVAGTKSSATGSDAWVAEIDLSAAPGSEVVWEHVYDHPVTAGADHARGVAVTPGGEIVVTGETSEPEHPRVWTRKLDATGAETWTAIYLSEQSMAGEKGDESGADVIVARDGTIYVAGTVIQETLFNMTIRDVALLAYDANGVLLWDETWDGPGEGISPSDDQATGVVQAGGGALVLSGSRRVAGEDGGFLIAWPDGGGVPLWQTVYADIQIRDVTTDDASRLAVTGQHGNKGWWGVVTP